MNRETTMPSRNNQQLLVTSDFRKLQMIQTGGKKLSCEICDKCFSQSGSLEIHMMGHTQENQLFANNVENIYPQ